MKQSTMTDAVYVLGGALVGRFAGSAVRGLVNKVFNTTQVPPVVSDLIPVIAGVYLAGKKSNTMKMIGYGMIAGGGSRMLGELIPAIGSLPRSEVIKRMMNPMMNRPANQSILQRPMNDSYGVGVPANQSILQGSAEPGMRTF